MKTITSLGAVVLATSIAVPLTGVRAQGQLEVVPSVDAVPAAYEVLPARDGDEGPLRYDARPPQNRADYLPATPVFVDRPLKGPAALPVIYDTRTGVETVLAEGVGPSGPLGSVAGRSFGDAVDAQNYETVSSPPSAVTGSVFPWNVHCRMWYSDTSGGNWVCSGTLIDARTMITAGHCVHEGNGGDWMVNVVVSPGWDGDDDFAGSANGTILGSYTGWTVSGSFDDDMGTVRLDRPVGFLSSWHGYGYNDDDAWWTSTMFNIVGWPGGCFAGAPDQLYYAWGPWENATSTIVSSNVNWPCWFGGMSGGGDYWIDLGDRYVGAVNSHGVGKPVETTYIGSTRITGGKYSNMVNSFVPDAYPDATIDLIPLAVTANPTVKAGSGIAGMSYRVVNASHYNPIGTSVYPVDVYLSTNDNISTFDTLIESHTFSWNFDPMSQVTVNMGAPVVPGTTVPGNYWTGVIVDIVDYDVNNNDTDGWDAAPVTVAPVCDAGAWGWVGGVGKSGALGVPLLTYANYPVIPSSNYSLTISGAYPSISGYLIFGFSYINANFDGGKMYPNPDILLPITVNGSGAMFLPLPLTADPAFCGVNGWVQAMFPGDPGATGFRQTSQTRYVGMTFGQ